MRFQKLDLNLLVALNALISDKSVSLAAEQLNLSQSATSSALGRLRDYFEDELLVLKGRNMVLTPLAERLAQPVADILGQISKTIAVSKIFDPAVSDRTISVIASEYTLEVLLYHAMLVIAEEAPMMKFEFLPLGDNMVDQLQRGQADLLITLDTVLSTEHPSEFLFDDDYVVVGWSGNRALNEQMTKEAYEKIGHVMPRFGKERTPSFEEWALKSQLVNRRIEIVAPSFNAVAGFVIGSDRIATMLRRLAYRIARAAPLKIMEVPFEVPKIRQAVQWASSTANDPAICWFVRRIRQIANDLDVMSLP